MKIAYATGARSRRKVQQTSNGAHVPCSTRSDSGGHPLADLPLMAGEIELVQVRQLARTGAARLSAGAPSYRRGVRTVQEMRQTPSDDQA